MRYFESPPEGIHMLFYDVSINRFRDESGEVLNDLSCHFSTWVLDKWRKSGKTSAMVLDKSNEFWEIIYDPDVCLSDCKRCKTMHKCDVYAIIKDIEKEEVSKWLEIY